MITQYREKFDVKMPLPKKKRIGDIQNSRPKDNYNNLEWKNSGDRWR